MPKPKSQGSALYGAGDSASYRLPTKDLNKRKQANIFQFFTSDQHNSALLKKAEKNISHQHSRHRSWYQDNETASLLLSLSNEELINHTDNELLHLVKNNLIAHSMMRIDLFFYTLCAYHQTNLHPILGRTYLQHGRGRTVDEHQLLTAACHNSMLPSLVDETVLNESAPERHLCLLSNTHFMDSLNSTTELPPFANKLDDQIEALCREQSIHILRAVSLGKINPVDGLNLFLHALHTALTDLKLNAAKTNNTLQLEMIELIMEHALRPYFDEESSLASDSYLHMMLQLSPNEIKLCRDEKKKNAIYRDHFCTIQTAILNGTKNEPIAESMSIVSVTPSCP